MKIMLVFDNLVFDMVIVHIDEARLIGRVLIVVID